MRCGGWPDRGDCVISRRIPMGLRDFTHTTVNPAQRAIFMLSQWIREPTELDWTPAPQPISRCLWYFTHLDAGQPLLLQASSCRNNAISHELRLARTVLGIQIASFNDRRWGLPPWAAANYATPVISHQRMGATSSTMRGVTQRADLPGSQRNPTDRGATSADRAYSGIACLIRGIFSSPCRGRSGRTR